MWCVWVCAAAGRVLMLEGARLETHRHHPKAGKRNNFSVIVRDESEKSQQYAVELGASSPREVRAMACPCEHRPVVPEL